jgi:hypothetical protein
MKRSKRAPKERFLEEMDLIILWERASSPHYSRVS